MKEHQTVVLKEKFEELEKGTVGVIVHVYPSKTTFEIEFFVNGRSVVKTIGKRFIKPKRK